MGVRVPPQTGEMEADPFDDIKIDKDKFGLKDIKRNPMAAYNGLSDFQRFVAKNFFDTQPKRRKAYFRQLGYETSPDGESIRPLDSDGSFKTIDKGLFDEEGNLDFSGYIAAHNLLTEEGREEILKDFSDMTYDTATGGMIAAGGAEGGSLGASVGAAVGSPSGPGAGLTAIIGGLVGTFTGGAAANAASEGMKDVIGDFFLDEEVPMDMKETFYQSLTAGGLATLAKGGSDGLKKLIGAWKKRGLEKTKEALKQAAIRKSNGAFSQDLAEDLMTHPDNYTPKAVEGSTRKLLKLSDDIFGTSAENPHSTRQLTGGIAKRVINPLNDRADLEIQKLSKDAAANFTVDEIENMLQKRMKGLKAKTFNTSEEERAMTFIRDELKRFKSKMKVKRPETNILDAAGNPIKTPDTYKEATFKEGRDFLKSLQNAVYDENTPVKGNPILKGLTREIKELADTKATELGSDLAKINAKRSEILRTYENFQRTVRDGHMQNAYVGKDNISRERAQSMFEEMDQVLDSNLAEQAQSSQFQSAVEGVYNKPNAMFGSGNAVGEGLKEGLNESVKQAFRFGTAGSVVPGIGPVAGAKVGAVKGGLEGFKRGMSFASPETFLRRASKIQSRIDDIDAGKSIFNKIPAAVSPAIPGTIDDTSKIVQDSIAPKEPAMPVEEAAVGPTGPAQPMTEPMGDPFDSIIIDKQKFGLGAGQP